MVKLLVRSQDVAVLEAICPSPFRMGLYFSRRPWVALYLKIRRRLSRSNAESADSRPVITVGTVHSFLHSVCSRCRLDADAEEGLTDG